MIKYDLITEVKSDKLIPYWAKLKLLSIAMVLSSLIYGLVISVLDQVGSMDSFSIEHQSDEFSLMVRNILIGVSLMIIVITTVIGNILSKKVAKGDSKSPAAIDSPLAPNLMAYQNYNVIKLVMLDSVGVFALLIYFLTHDFQWALILIGCSAVIKLLNFPSQNRFITIMDKHRQYH